MSVASVVSEVRKTKIFFSKMEKEHRYSLASNKVPKLTCPYCGAKKHWQRYIDIETGEVLPEQHGRCDNEGKCGKWVTPKDTGYAKAIWEQEQGNRSELPNNWKPQRKKTISPPPEPIFFDFETFKQTLERERYEKNNFIQNLFYNVQFPFEVQDVTDVIQLYRLGTVANGYRTGAVTFPFIDAENNVRAIQVKQFDKANHTTGTDFLHSIIEKHHTENKKPLPEWLQKYKEQDKKVSCLFGEHLLTQYPNNPIALVEAPKTAIYGTLYFGLPKTPKNFIWLAVYNKSSFSIDRLKVLEGRSISVFPDLSKDGCTFNEWETKAKEFEAKLKGTKFIFSNLLEQLAPEQDREQGKDIADYLIKLDWQLFRKQNIQEQPSQPKAVKVTGVTKVTEKENILFSHAAPPINNTFVEYTENWINDIEVLEAYFKNYTSPTEPIKLNNGGTINNCSQFIETHLEIIKANNGNDTFLPYLNRLENLKKILS